MNALTVLFGEVCSVIVFGHKTYGETIQEKEGGGP